MLYMKRSPYIDAVKYEKGMEDGFMKVADFTKTEGTEKPYIIGAFGMKKIVDENQYIVIDIENGLRDVYTEEKLHKEYVISKDKAE